VAVGIGRRSDRRATPEGEFLIDPLPWIETYRFWARLAYSRCRSNTDRNLSSPTGGPLVRHKATGQAPEAASIAFGIPSALWILATTELATDRLGGAARARRPGRPGCNLLTANSDSSHRPQGGEPSTWPNRFDSSILGSFARCEFRRWPWPVATFPIEEAERWTPTSVTASSQTLGLTRDVGVAMKTSLLDALGSRRLLRPVHQGIVASTRDSEGGGLQSCTTLETTGPLLHSSPAAGSASQWTRWL